MYECMCIVCIQAYMVTKEIQTRSGVIHITFNGWIHSVQTTLFIRSNESGDTEVTIQALGRPVYTKLLQPICLGKNIILKKIENSKFTFQKRYLPVISRYIVDLVHMYVHWYIHTYTHMSEYIIIHTYMQNAESTVRIGQCFPE